MTSLLSTSLKQTPKRYGDSAPNRSGITKNKQTRVYNEYDSGSDVCSLGKCTAFTSRRTCNGNDWHFGDQSCASTCPNQPKCSQPDPSMCPVIGTTTATATFTSTNNVDTANGGTIKCTFQTEPNSSLFKQSKDATTWLNWFQNSTSDQITEYDQLMQDFCQNTQTPSPPTPPDPSLAKLNGFWTGTAPIQGDYKIINGIGSLQNTTQQNPISFSVIGDNAFGLQAPFGDKTGFIPKPFYSSVTLSGDTISGDGVSLKKTKNLPPPDPADNAETVAPIGTNVCQNYATQSSSTDSRFNYPSWFNTAMSDYCTQKVPNESCPLFADISQEVGGSGPIKEDGCSRFMSIQNDGTICRAWAAAQKNLGDAAMKHYCDNHHTKDCLCINRGQVPLFNDVIDALGGPTKAADSPPHCYYLPCSDNNRYLVTTADQGGNCPNVCKQVVTIFADKNSNVPINELKQFMTCCQGDIDPAKNPCANLQPQPNPTPNPTPTPTPGPGPAPLPPASGPLVWIKNNQQIVIAILIAFGLLSVLIVVNV
jgi:hypothetical protein